MMVGQLLGTMSEYYDRSLIVIQSQSRLLDIINTNAGREWCVAANDALSVIIQQCLERCHAKPGEKLRLVSFDDSTEALSRSISSFNFNSSATASAMLMHLTDPFSPVLSGSRKSVVEIDGYVVERSSTG